MELQIKEGFEKEEGTKFEVFREKNDKINFRLKEADGNIVLSGSGYDNVEDCLDAVESARESLIDMGRSTELTAIRKKPDFVQRKAMPVYKSLEEEQTQVRKRSADISFLVHADKRQRPTFISGRISEEKVLSAPRAIRSLNYLHHTMGFENAEQEFPEEGVEVRRYDGSAFYRMKQYHRGIPVLGQTLILSTDQEGNTETLSGQYAPISCDDDVMITEEQAKGIAEKESGKALSSEGLIYYVDGAEKAYLCWRIDTEEYALYISTVNGDIVYRSPNIISVDINTGRRINTLLGEEVLISILNKGGDSPYSLYDGVRKIEIYDDHNTRADPRAIEVTTTSTEDDAVLTNQNAVTAYDNIKRVYDYYRNVLGRKGADAKGKKIRIIMNDHNYTGSVNACFYGGKKDRTQIGLSTAGGMDRCLDVLGHEFTHAVNDAIWDPVYANESGALDEAYSDIMGEFAQDDTLDLHGENRTSGSPRRFDNSYTMDDYKYVEPTQDNDRGYVHAYSQIISRTAFLIQQKWPDAVNRCELSALFYKSMEYLGNKSGFRDCYYALLCAALKIDTGYNMRKKIGAIADAFLETRVMSSSGRGTRKVTGKVSDTSIGEGAPGVTVTAKCIGSSDPAIITITNSKGEYALQLKDASKYTLSISRIDGFAGSIQTQAISDKNCGPFNFGSERKFDFCKQVFFVSGYVKNPDSGRAIAGATVKILKGKHTDSQVMTMKPDIVLKTDNNGYFFTATLTYGEYDLWAYAVQSSTYCLTKIVHLDHRIDPVLSLTLERKKRFYVTDVSICTGKTRKEAQSKIRSGHTLIDVDLNKGTGGDFIYLSYGVDNTSTPLTNLLVYESNKAQTWDSKEITHNNIKAVYKRVKVDLNRGSGGKFLYLCYTTDGRFRPLTNLDVLVKGKNVVREPYWSGVRVVKGSNVSVDSYSDVNAGSGGSYIYIMQTKREIV